MGQFLQSGVEQKMRLENKEFSTISILNQLHNLYNSVIALKDIVD